MQKQAELYRGKAKTVYSTENPDLLVLEFRNDTSAGDGARIEQFDRKGMVNNKFNYFIMSKLAEAGIPTQMERLLSDTECLVKKLDMVPVECVVRNRAQPATVRSVPEKRRHARSDGQRILLRNLWLGEQRESGAYERADLQSERRAEKTVR